MITFLFIVIFTLLAVAGYLLWAFHQRLEKLASAFGTLAAKVREGEKVIVQNFLTIEKRFKKVENEIHEAQRLQPQTKEVLKAAQRLQRGREQQS